MLPQPEADALEALRRTDPHRGMIRCSGLREDARRRESIALTHPTQKGRPEGRPFSLKPTDP